MSERLHCTFLLSVLATCLAVACNDGIAGQREAVVVTITAEAPGYGAEQVDDLVTTPITIALNGIPDVQSIRSRTTAGRAVVWVEFVSGTAVYKARQATAERLQLAAGKLPQAVVPRLAPVLAPDEIMLVALWFVGKTPEEDARRATELRELADDVVHRRLAAIPGVAQVVVTGGLVGQYQVIISTEKALQFGVTVSELVSAIEKVFAEDTARPPMQETLVVRGELTPDDLGETVLAMRQDRAIRLKDVAQVRLRNVPPHRAASRPKDEAKTPPQPAVLLGVLRQPGFDAKRLSRELDRHLKDLAATLPADLHLGRQFPPELAPLASQMAEDIQQDLPPEVTFRQETSADLRAVLVRRSAARTTIAIVGPDRERLRSAGRDLADRLRKVPGVADVQADLLEETPQMRINVDRRSAARLGVSVSEIAATVALAREGRKVGRLQDSRTHRAVDVIVTCGGGMRNDAESLQKLPLTTATGATVTLGQVAKFEVVSVPHSLNQEQKQPAILISCEVQARDRARATAEIKRAVAAIEQKLPTGYHVRRD
ncbi:MAG: efflux RND transporter permease subunit [Candidatus Nealsonbacteria bacterium]|nr:efflux RND transporter permease subunit [Candidatus Nealsonbacteria bacterium]